MFSCPNCHTKQVRTEVRKGVFWVCESCGGRIATIGLLRRLRARSLVEAYWSKARRRKRVWDEGHACPSCERVMREVSLGEEAGLPSVDVCRHCQLFWFDPREYEALPPRRPDPVPDPAPARRRLLRRTRRRSLSIRPTAPTWEWLFFLAGFPLESESARVRRFAWMTWSIGLLLAIGTLLGLVYAPTSFEELGLVPEVAWRRYGLTFVTGFFLHGGIVHLLGNLYFLLVFGDNVEDFLGVRGLVLLLAAGTFAGDLLHVAVDPASTIPAIGASGGISALIAFYALRFRRAKLLVLFTVLPVKLSAWTAFVVWGLWQGVLLVGQVREVSSVSAAAHIGGVLVGALFWFVEEAWFRRQSGDP